MYIKHCKLSKKKQQELMKLFLANTSARMASKIVNVNRNTGILFFRKVREVIDIKMSKNKEKLSGEVEVDEMYYGKRKGSKGRNAKGKKILFGMKTRGGKVIIKNIKGVDGKTITQEIYDNIAKNSLIYSDSFRSYNKIDQEKYEHKTEKHSKTYVDRKDKTIDTNSIENVWRQVRRYFNVYNGVSKNFKLFLSEVMFRINYTDLNVQKKLLNKWSML